MSLSIPERMAKLEEKMDNAVEKISSLDAKFDEFIKNADQRYAGKWAERVLIFVGSTVGVAIIGALMGLILSRNGQ